MHILSGRSASEASHVVSSANRTPGTRPRLSLACGASVFVRDEPKVHLRHAYRENRARPNGEARALSTEAIACPPGWRCSNRSSLVLLLAGGQPIRRSSGSWGAAQRSSVGGRSVSSKRLAGLYTRHAGRRATVLTPATEARILTATRREPADGSTHWTMRKLARHLGTHHMMLARTWLRAGLKSHRLKR